MTESTNIIYYNSRYPKKVNPLVLSFAEAVYLFSAPFLFLFSYVLFNITNSLYPLLVGFTITYIWTLIYAIRKFGLFSLYCLFLYTSVFFIYSIVFAEVLFPHSDFDFLTITWPCPYEFDLDVGVKFIIASFIQTYVMHIVFCFHAKKSKSKSRKLNVKYEYPVFVKTGIAIVFIFMIPCLLKSILQVKYVIQHGYSSIFLGGVSDINYPFWMRGAFTGVMAGYCVFLAGNPRKKIFKIVTFIYLFLNLVNALKGARALVICSIIICAYWYYKKYNVKISLKKYILVGFLIIALILGLDSIRNVYGGKNINSDYSSSFVESSIETLVSQSRSRVVPMLVIEGDLEYRNYPFVFSPLLLPYYSYKYGSGQTDEIAKNTNDISNVTMYHLSKIAYSNGVGCGGSFLAEAYDFYGVFGVIVFSCILSVCLAKIDCSSLNFKYFSIPFVFQFLLSIPMMPRNRLLGFMSNYISIVLSYFIIFVLILLFDRKRFFNFRRKDL